MKYDAFISYRHTEADMYIAKKIHKGLETFKVPRSIEKIGGKKNIQRVFRDQEELPIGSDLDDNILAALKISEFLIVVCSPRTPQSHWVLKEIDTFIKLHDRDHVLAILIEGEPDESFPEALLVDDNGEKIEPLAADVRGKDKAEINKKLKTELIRLAAPLLHCSYDDLKQRHRERKLKRIIAATAVAGAIIAGLSIGFALYNAHMLKIINEHYTQKQISQSKYLSETSLELLKSGDRRSATLLALAALPDENNDMPVVPEAKYALSAALSTYDMGLDITLDKQLKHDLSINFFHLSNDGTYTTTIDNNFNVYVWDNATADIVYKEEAHNDEYGFPIDVKYANVLSDKIVIAAESYIKVLTLEGDELFSREVSYLNDCIDTISYTELLCITSDAAYILDTENATISDTIDNPTSSMLTGASSISEDLRYVTLVMHSATDEASFYIYDRQTKKGVLKSVPYQYISQTETGNNGCAYLLCDNYDLLNSDFSENTTYCIVAINNDEESDIIWKKEFSIKIGTINSTKFFLKVRTFEDSNGKEFPSVVAVIGNMMYDLNAITGEELLSNGFTSNVAKLSTSKNGYAVVAVEDGNIYYYNLLTGYSYDDNTIKSGIYISDMYIQGGIVAIKSGLSPDITLMSTHIGPDYVELNNDIPTSAKYLLSNDKKYYAMIADDYFENSFDALFYNAKDDSVISELHFTDRSHMMLSGMIDEHKYLLVNDDKELTIIDIETGETTTNTIDTPTNDINTIAISENGKYIALSDSQKIWFFDIATGNVKEIMSQVPSHNCELVVSNDGKYVYMSSHKAPLCRIDTQSSAESTTNLDSELKSRAFTNDAQSLVISPDGNYLALCCDDNMLRIIDAKNEKISDEIPLPTRSEFYLIFSKDSKYLYFQGDDYLFKVYSIDDKAVIHVDTEQYNTIQSITEYDDFIAIYTYYELRFLTKDTYSRETEVESGIFYNPANNRIYTKTSKYLYSFPYADLDTLRQRALDTYKDDMFTELEKMKYHIE